MPENHTVSIVDDSRQLRETIRDLVEDEGWTIEHVFPNAEAAEKILLGDTRPDVILMDIEMPGISGIELTRRIRTLDENVGILMLTVYDDADLVFEAISAGASGYLIKRDIPDRLASAMEEILTGSTPVSSAVARKMFRHFQASPQPTPNQPPEDTPEWKLTKREGEILDGLVSGQLYKEIASNLQISVDTVRFHLKNIYKKLHVSSRTEAVVKYMKQSE